MISNCLVKLVDLTIVREQAVTLQNIGQGCLTMSLTCLHGRHHDGDTLEILSIPNGVADGQIICFVDGFPERLLAHCLMLGPVFLLTFSAAVLLDPTTSAAIEDFAVRALLGSAVCARGDGVRRCRSEATLGGEAVHCEMCIFRRLAGVVLTGSRLSWKASGQCSVVESLFVFVCGG